jgi:hypothetical protein
MAGTGPRSDLRYRNDAIGAIAANANAPSRMGVITPWDLIRI